MMNKTMFKSGGQCLGGIGSCFENVNSLNSSLIHARVGERVILGNNSRLLHKELGQ